MKVYQAAILLAMIGSSGAEEFGGGAPTSFETRNNGSIAKGAASIEKKEATKSRKVTYVAVCDVREWRNSEGKLVRARMLAFDRGPEAADKLALRLVSDGKIRLLVEGQNRFSLFPLAKLSLEDQAFVKKLVADRKAVAAKKSGNSPE